MKNNCHQLLLLVATSACQWIGSNGFTTTTTTTTYASRRTTTELFNVEYPTSTGWDSFESLASGSSAADLSAEEQRPFRRTVYTPDDWVKHRDQDRFIDYVLAIFKRGVYDNLSREVGLTVGIAGFVVFYNALVGGYLDFAGVQQAAIITSDYLPKIGLPLSVFTLTSPSLGLLLVFRTNSSYQRWDEARKNWGRNINHTRNLNRLANAYYDDTNVTPQQRADDLNHVALCTWAFVRSMKRHLSPEWEDEAAFAQELYQKLPPQQAEKILQAAHRPNRALQDLSYAVDDLPMHFMRKNEIHACISIFEDNLGSSERILTSPVPLFYSRHLARFLAVWLLLLPLGFYEAFSSTWNHMALLPATAVISTMLFGIEEIGTQLEEPFTVLPMQAFCDKIYNWCMEISKWTPGDNGRLPLPVRDEHAFFSSGPGATTRVSEPVNGNEQQPSQQANGVTPSSPPLAPPPPAQPSPVGAAPTTSAAAQAAKPPQALSFAEFLKAQGQGK